MAIILHIAIARMNRASSISNNESLFWRIMTLFSSSKRQRPLSVANAKELEDSTSHSHKLPSPFDSASSPWTLVRTSYPGFCLSIRVYESESESESEKNRQVFAIFFERIELRDAYNAVAWYVGLMSHTRSTVLGLPDHRMQSLGITFYGHAQLCNDQKTCLKIM